MVKLLRACDHGNEYWEIWNDKASVIVNEGIVGELGTFNTFPVLPKKELKAFIDSQVHQKMTEGFHILEPEELTDFFIQYQILGFGTSEDLEQRHKIETVMDDILGWTGNGHCAGGDIGSNTMNIHCQVINVEYATQTTIIELGKLNFDTGMILAYDKDDEYIVIFPPGGEFQLL